MRQETCTCGNKAAWHHRHGMCLDCKKPVPRAE